jgi:para-aminobenzoate synthetase/4-amino-4-deoxychorismate lyase
MKTPTAPDPARGLFETLLVLDGRPVALDAHLERLSTSLEALFGATPPTGLAAEIAARARGLDLGRMRVVVDPRGAAATITAQEVDPANFFPDRGHGAELRSLPCPGGLGAHKWADREFLGEARGEPLPLLFDIEEEVLEAGRGNVFAAFAGELRTPAADGRILPGTARAAAIELARDGGVEVREGRLTRDDLFAADEVFLTGSVRGVEPARSLDGDPLATTGEVGALIAVALRRQFETRGTTPAAPRGRSDPRRGREAATSSLP